MSQWENWEIVKVLSDRQTLVQEQKCWAVFHSSFFLFFNSLPFFNPEACFALLFCFESPCPPPYEAWEALAGFSRECFSCYDRCSSLPCKPFDFPVRQFSLWSKWTQRVSKQQWLILALSLRLGWGSADPGWYYLSGSASSYKSRWAWHLIDWGLTSDPRILIVARRQCLHRTSTSHDDRRGRERDRRVRDDS